MNPNVEKLLKLPLWQRLLLLVFLNGILVGFFFFFYFTPKLEILNQKETQLQDLNRKLASDQRIADNLPKFKEEYQKLQGKLKEALAELPDQREIPSLLSSIASLARDRGLEVVKFKPSPEVPQGFYSSVPVELKLNGPFHQVVLFFQDVGGLSRIVNIGSLKIGVPSSGENNYLSVECVATTFRFLENSQQEKRP